MKTLTLSISQFNTFIKQIIDAEEFLYNVAVFGEVTNLKQSGANFYFDLKDENAMLSCVKFGNLDCDLKNGDKVTVYGKVNFYVKSGRLNFVVAKIQAFGLGELYKKFLELKDKLQKEGIFDDEIKKEIPKYAKNIGVVTSETGAVIRDIINVTRKKNKSVNIHIYPAKVQGANAEDTIIDGIKYFDNLDYIDVVIIARGGGSFEDLAPFNTEALARAIYSANKPIISAVGHETDFSICDFAADLRVPTPSVAAEVAVFNEFEQINMVKTNLNLIENILSLKLNKLEQSLKQNFENLSSDLSLKILNTKHIIVSSEEKIKNLIDDKYKNLTIKVLHLDEIISKLNPIELLKSGFLFIEKDGKRLASVNEIKIGDKVEVDFCDGKAEAEIKNISKVGK